MLDENETLEDLVEEAEQETVEAEHAEKVQARIEKGDPILSKLAAGVPVIATNLYWKKRGLGKLTAEEGAAIHEESLKAMQSYNVIELPDWLASLIEPLETIVKPWVGVGLVIYKLTEQRERMAKAERARDVTPANDNSDGEGVEYV